MRLLVTGGAGFIGAVAARRGLLRGDEVWVLDDLSRAGSEARLVGLFRDGLEPRRLLRVDLSDRGAATAALEGVPEPDAVLHLASQVAVTTSVEDPLRDFQVNAAGTVHLLEWVRRRAPGAALVYASTNKVYGELADLVVERRGDRLAFRDLPRGVAEDRPVDFHSPYGCSKGAADLYCVDYARIFGLHTAVLRQSCIYGPEQSGEERQGWVSCFARAVRDRAPLTFYGDGYQTRDLLHVEDLCDLYDVVIHRGERLAGDVYNVGGGAPTARSLWEVLGELQRVSGITVPVRHGPIRPGDQPVFVADVGKAERELGWRPRIQPEEGVAGLWEEMAGRG